jgi:hypothetical protein
VLLSRAELNVREIRSALEGRRLDAALIPSFMLWPDATVLPIYCEPLVAALPVEHPFSACSAMDWASLADETILVQTWSRPKSSRCSSTHSLEAGLDFSRMPQANIHARTCQRWLRDHDYVPKSVRNDFPWCHL